MHISSAVFTVSSQKLSQCPTDGLPEFALIGRSNVGKSSLINMLTDRPGLAKVSSTPGKTRLINHFKINAKWYLVDLPGYGYARVSKNQRGEFSKLITDYVQKREAMVFLFVLIDSRLDPQKIDLDFIRMLGEHGVPFGLIFTKCDKQSDDRTSSNGGEISPENAGNMGRAAAGVPYLFRKKDRAGRGTRFYRTLFGDGRGYGMKPFGFVAQPFCAGFRYFMNKKLKLIPLFPRNWRTFARK